MSKYGAVVAGIALAILMFGMMVELAYGLWYRVAFGSLPDTSGDFMYAVMAVAMTLMVVGLFLVLLDLAVALGKWGGR